MSQARPGSTWLFECKSCGRSFRSATPGTPPCPSCGSRNLLLVALGHGERNLSSPKSSDVPGTVVLAGRPLADVVAIAISLVMGGHTVSWRSAGDDGHARRGDFVFTLRGTD